MEKSLSGKSALVTGGSGGFGKACAIALARDGASVTLMGRSEESLSKARDAVAKESGSDAVSFFAGDATSENGVASAVEAAIGEHGTLDIGIGVVGGTAGYFPITDRKLDDFMGDLLLNIGSAFLLTHLAAPRMTNGGAFVFISSTASELAFAGLSSYCAGKAGLDHFMHVAALELAKQNIRVNTVRPGLTRTDGMDWAFDNQAYIDSFKPFIPLGRTGLPGDIANAVRYLAGPEADWVTGQSFAVDGGNELLCAPLT